MGNEPRQQNNRPRNGYHHQSGPPPDHRPVIASPQPPKEWQPRTQKEIRDADWFLHTPAFARPTMEDMAERKNRQWDIDQCLIQGRPFWEISNPRSELGKEAPKLRAEQIAQAANADKEAKRKAKRSASQKAARQRKAAAKRAAKELPPAAE